MEIQIDFFFVHQKNVNLLIVFWMAWLDGKEKYTMKKWMTRAMWIRETQNKKKREQSNHLTLEHSIESKIIQHFRSTKLSILDAYCRFLVFRRIHSICLETNRRQTSIGTFFFSSLFFHLYLQLSFCYSIVYTSVISAICWVISWFVPFLNAEYAFGLWLFTFFSSHLISPHVWLSSVCIYRFIWYQFWKNIEHFPYIVCVCVL